MPVVYGDCRNGHGKYRWDVTAIGVDSLHARGDAYEGQWKDDKEHGTGTYTYADGSKYEGQWEGRVAGATPRGTTLGNWVTTAASGAHAARAAPAADPAGPAAVSAPEPPAPAGAPAAAAPPAALGAHVAHSPYVQPTCTCNIS